MSPLPLRVTVNLDALDELKRKAEALDEVKAALDAGEVAIVGPYGAVLDTFNRIYPGPSS